MATLLSSITLCCTLLYFVGLISWQNCWPQLYACLDLALVITGVLPTSPGARFSKAPETFRARKAVFRSSVSQNSKVYTPETSCMRGTSLHLKNMRIKQLCNRKVRDFPMALLARKVSGAFEKRPPGHYYFPVTLVY